MPDSQMCQQFPILCTNVPDINTGGGGGSVIPPDILIRTSPSGQIGVQSRDRFTQILDSILSGVAIFRNKDYIPTTEVPNSYGGGGALPPEYYALLAQQNYNQGSGKVEQFIKDNALLLGGGLVVFFLYQSGRK